MALQDIYRDIAELVMKILWMKNAKLKLVVLENAITKCHAENIILLLIWKKRKNIRQNGRAEVEMNKYRR